MSLSSWYLLGTEGGHAKFANVQYFYLLGTDEELAEPGEAQLMG